MKKVLIVEDNLAAAGNMREIVRCADIQTEVYIADNIMDAYALAMDNVIDLMLVDIALDSKKTGDVSGMKFAENIRTVEKYKFTPIIMVTSLEDPKLYAYSEVHCYSYIEKPIDSDKTIKIIREALQFTNNKKKNNKYVYKKDGIFYSVDLNKVIYVENKRKEVYVHMESESFSIPYISMGELLTEMNNDDFMQCSRNCIINSNYIEFVDVTNKYIKLKGVLRQIDIGITYRKNILAHIKND